MNAGPQGKRWHWYTVPAGTRASQCRGCKAVIFWIENANGRKVPVDCDTVDGSNRPSEPSNSANGVQRAPWDGHGVSHFQTCPDADQFSGRGKR